MSDDLEGLIFHRRPRAEQPLAGMTVLLVEDSRFASEAIRLLCMRSGARIRRADTLAAAHRHLRVYRPTVVIVDMGLPDGSGADLIEDLVHSRPRVAVVLGISGDAAGRELALGAGADAFIEKPIESLAAFQQLVLAQLPESELRAGLHVLPDDMITPDPMALRDDLSHIADVIGSEPEGAKLDYIAQFLGGVARSAHDRLLERAAAKLANARQKGQGTSIDLARVAGLVQERLSTASPI